MIASTSAASSARRLPRLVRLPKRLSRSELQPPPDFGLGALEFGVQLRLANLLRLDLGPEAVALAEFECNAQFQRALLPPQELDLVVQAHSSTPSARRR